MTASGAVGVKRAESVVRYSPLFFAPTTDNKITVVLVPKSKQIVIAGG